MACIDDFCLVVIKIPDSNSLRNGLLILAPGFRWFGSIVAWFHGLGQVMMTGGSCEELITSWQKLEGRDW